MSLRADREDYTRQREAVTNAQLELRRTLENLAVEAKLTAKAVTNKRAASTDYVRAYYLRFERAEEQLDIARFDLATAMGEDA